MPRLSFVSLDVFTSRPLQGNQLAVFPDGRGLTDQQLQDIAREMHFSETTFILPRDAATERERGVRVRIFTVAEELPFAGHPTLGTAKYLARVRNEKRIVLDLNVGQVPIDFSDGKEGLFGEMRQVNPKFGQKHSREDVARASGVPLEDLATDWPIQTVSTGNAFVVVPLRSLDAAHRLRVDAGKSAEYLGKTDGKFFYFVTRETETPGAFLHARMIFYGGEDPATGSAAGPCAAWMVQHGVAKPGQQVIIEQGVEMKRPSFLHVRADRDDDSVVNVRVGGYAVETVEGFLSF